jgi:hypothetical protein
MMPASVAAQFGIPWPWESALAQMGCLAVVLFGRAYWMMARDPGLYRPYVTFGIICKVVTVIVLYGNWLGGNLPFSLAALSTVDAIYAVLFARFIVQTQHRAPSDLSRSDLIVKENQ